MKRQKKWHDYLWIFSLIYLALGFFNILFAWLGMICFLAPLLIAVIRGNKAYCNKYCGRGQLFNLLGGKLGISARRNIPGWLGSKWFRYGFLTFFMLMFGSMVFATIMVLLGSRDLTETVKLLWVFKVPWKFAYFGSIGGWVAQFAFGLYGVMLTSTILGLLTMVIYKPRSWCVYCPMGSMTQLICKVKHKKHIKKESAVNGD